MFERERREEIKIVKQQELLILTCFLIYLLPKYCAEETKISSFSWFPMDFTPKNLGVAALSSSQPKKRR